MNIEHSLVFIKNIKERIHCRVNFFNKLDLYCLTFYESAKLVSFEIANKILNFNLNNNIKRSSKIIIYV